MQLSLDNLIFRGLSKNARNNIFLSIILSKFEIIFPFHALELSFASYSNGQRRLYAYNKKSSNRSSISIVHTSYIHVKANASIMKWVWRTTLVRGTWRMVYRDRRWTSDNYSTQWWQRHSGVSIYLEFCVSLVSRHFSLSEPRRSCPFHFLGFCFSRISINY